MSSQYFFSLDWGTSSFRLRLVDPFTQSVIAECLSDDGITAVHAGWLKSSQSPADRIGFYIERLITPAQQLLKEAGIQLPALRIVISGMASSNIGMKELPYALLPLNMDATQLRIEKIAASTCEVQLISGAATHADVMRGEETQLIGAWTLKGTNGLYIFPGTHSKHVTVQQGRAVALRTFMTGEVFQVMTAYSLLKSGIEKTNENNNANTAAFCKGVLCGVNESLLHALFTVRTRQLLEQVNPQENYHYLSGLLIGAELKAIEPENLESITLCGEILLLEKYKMALNTMGIASPVHLVGAGTATVSGHLTVYQRIYGD